MGLRVKAEGIGCRVDVVGFRVWCIGLRVRGVCLQIIPTLGPKVYGYGLHWAIWSPRVCRNVQLQKGSM